MSGTVHVIYIDVLLFINLIVNYFLLRITAFFTKESPKMLRTALAAFAGALFSLVILLPSLHLALALVMKAGGAVIMAVIAFRAVNLRRLLRNAAYLFVASGLMAGGVLAAQELLQNEAFFARNLGVYIDMSPLILIVVALACYIGITLIELLFKKPARIEARCCATVQMDGRTLKFEGLIDSGNRLYDALTGRDAIVLKTSLAAKLLNARQLAALAQGPSGASAQHLSDIGDFALLPFSSIGGGGLLLGFGASACAVAMPDGKQIAIDRPFVAFADDSLLGEFDGMIGSDAVEV